jgi:hypothetical protein
MQEDMDGKKPITGLVTNTLFSVLTAIGKEDMDIGIVPEEIIERVQKIEGDRLKKSYLLALAMDRYPDSAEVLHSFADHLMDRFIIIVSISLVRPEEQGSWGLARKCYEKVLEVCHGKPELRKYLTVTLYRK